MTASMNGRSSASPDNTSLKKTPKKEVIACMRQGISLPYASSLKNRYQCYVNSQELVLVSYKIMWADGCTEISD
jgi:hypothetical protein